MSHEDLRNNIIRFFSSPLQNCDGNTVIVVYLFGSQTRGDQNTTSDIDIAVLLEKEPRLSLTGIGQQLASHLSSQLGKEVDLLVLNHAPPDLVHRVLRDGELLLDVNPSLRIRFEVQKRNEYFDLLPILREYRGQRPQAA